MPERTKSSLAKPRNLLPVPQCEGVDATWKHTGCMDNTVANSMLAV